MESNPEVWNTFMSSMGVAGGWGFTDVFGLDPELLMMVPQPVSAVMLLYPISENTEKLGIEKLAGNSAVSDGVFFMKQTVGNACGTVGILHSLLNNTSRIQIGDILSKFKTDCVSVDPAERADLLANSEVIAGKHAQAASSGQTAAPSAEEKVRLHFIAFVSVDGALYELDGRKERPVNWGPCSEDELLSEAAAACKGYMACDPEEMRFTVVALSKLD